MRRKEIARARDRRYPDGYFPQYRQEHEILRSTPASLRCLSMLQLRSGFHALFTESHTRRGLRSILSGAPGFLDLPPGAFGGCARNSTVRSATGSAASACAEATFCNTIMTARLRCKSW